MKKILNEEQIVRIIRESVKQVLREMDEPSIPKECLENLSRRYWDIEREVYDRKHDLWRSEGNKATRLVEAGAGLMSIYGYCKEFASTMLNGGEGNKREIEIAKMRYKSLCEKFSEEKKMVWSEPEGNRQAANAFIDTIVHIINLLEENFFNFV